MAYRRERRDRRHGADLGEQRKVFTAVADYINPRVVKNRLRIE
jgi:hypothetical protein